MGKGFNNYMTKKFFHPGSKENIKRVWMAQQKTDFEKQKQDDLMAQYQKEQEMYKNRALLGDEKAKLGLSFMYDAPPGLKKKEKEEPEAEVKFEWQRKYNAPREQYAMNDETIRDQPFGIEVRNVRCIKCRKWGHVNTDRICPLFGQDLTAEPPQPSTSASSLLESMENDGFTLKKSILGRMSNPHAENERLLESEDEDDPEVQFLKSLTPKQKKKLLKKLSRLQAEKEGHTSHKREKKKKKKSKHSKKRKQDSDDDRNKSKKKRSHQSSESSDDSESEEEASYQGKKRKDYKSEQNIKVEKDRRDSGDMFRKSRSQDRSYERHSVRSFNRQETNSSDEDRDIKQRHRDRHNDRRKESESKFRRSRSRSVSDREDRRSDRRRRSTEHKEFPRQSCRSNYRRQRSTERDEMSRSNGRSRSRERYRKRSRSTERRRRRDYS